MPPAIRHELVELGGQPVTTWPSADELRAEGIDPDTGVPRDPEYADVDEAGQLALGVELEQRAIPGLAKARTTTEEE